MQGSNEVYFPSQLFTKNLGPGMQSWHVSGLVVSIRETKLGIESLAGARPSNQEAPAEMGRVDRSAESEKVCNVT